MPIYGSTLVIMPWQLGISKAIPTIAGRGQANSKRGAEHAAAVEALFELKKIDGLSWPALYLTPKTRPFPSFQPQPEQYNPLQIMSSADFANRAAEYYGDIY
jgi:hypothetical protein